MDLGLTGLSVLVTGATQGIGRAIALGFAAEGCNIAICARSSDDVRSMEDTLRQAGAAAIGEPVDVRDSDGIQRVIERCVHTFGGLDIVVSNVSAATGDWHLMFDTDLMGAVRLFDAAHPYLLKSKAASFTAISSRAAYTGGGAYAAIKCALMSYVKGISWEYAPKGIRANIVSPGDIYFQGGIWDRIEHTDPTSWAEAQVRNRMGRLGTPQDIANAVVFISSPAASFISGTNLRVDGSGSPTTQF